MPGNESWLQPASPVTSRSANKTLCQTFPLKFPLIHLSLSVAGIRSSRQQQAWDLIDVPNSSPRSLCAFVPVIQLMLATMHVWYWSKLPGFMTVVIRLYTDVINIQVELKACLSIFFPFLSIVSKIESWEACKNGSCVFFFFDCQQLGARCSLQELTVIRQAGSFQHTNIWKTKTHNDQKAPEVSSSGTNSSTFSELVDFTASTKYDASCCS